MVAGTNSGGIYKSTDGIKWQQSISGIGEVIKDIASDGRQFIAIASCSILRNTSLLPQALCGDVNSNNTVNIVNALLVAQYYVGLPVTVFDDRVTDVNGDGIIDIIDALRIAQYYVGIISILACDPA